MKDEAPHLSEPTSQSSWLIAGIAGWLCLPIVLAVFLLGASQVATAEPWVVVTLPAQEGAKPATVTTGLLVFTDQQRAKLKLDAFATKPSGDATSSARVMQVGGLEAPSNASDTGMAAMRRWLGPDQQAVFLMELPRPAATSGPANPKSPAASSPAPAITFQGEQVSIYALDAASVARGQELLQAAGKAVRAALKEAAGGEDPLASAAWKSQRKALVSRPDSLWRVRLLEGDESATTTEPTDRAPEILQAWWSELLGAAMTRSPAIAQQAATALLASAVIPADELWINPSGSAPSQVVPLWPMGSTGGVNQLASLSQPARNASLSQRWPAARQAELVIRLEAMLAGVKVHHLWIIDEAGWIDAKTRSSRGLLGVMTPIATMQSSMRLQDEASVLAPSSVTAKPFITAGLLPSGPEQTSKLDPVISGPFVAAGDAQSGLIAVARPMEIKPPGLLIDRWIGEWSAERFVSQSLVAPSLPGATMLVQMQQPAGTAGQEPSVLIYLEWPKGITQVRVHIGPSAQQRAITIDVPSGMGEAKPSSSKGLSEQAARVRAVRKDDAFAATIELAPELIEPEGVIRLAVDLTSADGARWSWPRAMLPWQQTPGRMALMTSTWDVFPQKP